MGAVYRAVRVDDHYLKHVAIKLVRSGFASGQYLKRFKNERQIMASLEHPNIARLLDGGATDGGVPYIATIGRLIPSNASSFSVRFVPPYSTRIRT
jgi:eukaryotic-like serine/threonine-protein kinase